VYENRVLPYEKLLVLSMIGFVFGEGVGGALGGVGCVATGLNI